MIHNKYDKNLSKQDIDRTEYDDVNLKRLDSQEFCDIILKREFYKQQDKIEMMQTDTLIPTHNCNVDKP